MFKLQGLPRKPQCNFLLLVVLLLLLQLYLVVLNFRILTRVELLKEEKSRNPSIRTSKSKLAQARFSGEISDKRSNLIELKTTNLIDSPEATKFKREDLTAKNVVAETRKLDCDPHNHRIFPLCEEKFEFIKYMYKDIHCLRDVHQVDGDDCSVLRYLTQIEPYCPPNDMKVIEIENMKKSQEGFKKLKIRTDLDGALSVLSLKNFHWLRQRLRSSWPDWHEAALSLKRNRNFQKGEVKKIMFFLGSMAYQPEILSFAGKGGFVGELVQWTDLITSAYLLGHDVTVIANQSDLSRVLQPDENHCASKSVPRSRTFDIIFADLNGVMFLQGIGTSNFARLRCKLRILDSFGTEAEFNYHDYADPIPGGKSAWGSMDIILQQFLTYFPHSPDNSFLGFAAGNGKTNDSYVKKDIAVIYGKYDYYLQGNVQYLDVIKDYFEVHATMALSGNGKGDIIPTYVINHGVMKVTALKDLLAQAKLLLGVSTLLQSSDIFIVPCMRGWIFIGLGFPFEGPGPLEAIANGAVFLNPKFIPPKDKLNDAFFKIKPNLRKLTSQNPYLEDFVGEPFVYTIDFRDTKILKATLQKIKDKKTFEQYLPREFTNKGMLEKLNALIQHQNFCDTTARRWPPLENLELFLADKGVSCKHVCRKRGRICEPSYFSDINTAETFKRLGVSCQKTTTAKKTYHPSYDSSTHECFLQGHILYFSCVAENPTLSRLCPCRDFQKGQTSLCSSCS